MNTQILDEEHCRLDLSSYLVEDEGPGHDESEWGKDNERALREEAREVLSDRLAPEGPFACHSSRSRNAMSDRETMVDALRDKMPNADELAAVQEWAAAALETAGAPPITGRGLFSDGTADLWFFYAGKEYHCRLQVAEPRENDHYPLVSDGTAALAAKRCRERLFGPALDGIRNDLRFATTSGDR